MTPRYRLFRRLALAGVVLAFGVVVLGAWVRLSAAGLGCPDWPGCYGHASPIGASGHIAAAEAAVPTVSTPSNGARSTVACAALIARPGPSSRTRAATCRCRA